MECALLIAAAAVTSFQAPPSDLAVFGLGALHWFERREAIARSLPAWGPATRRDHLGALVVPGRVAYVRIGRCAFAASLEGAYGGLTHVLLDLRRGDRVRCAREMTARATRAFGAPERVQSYPPGKIEGLAWRVSGDLIRLTNIADPYGSLMVDLTTPGDHVITIH